MRPMFCLAWPRRPGHRRSARFRERPESAGDSGKNSGRRRPTRALIWSPVELQIGSARCSISAHLTPFTCDSGARAARGRGPPPRSPASIAAPHRTPITRQIASHDRSSFDRGPLPANPHPCYRRSVAKKLEETVRQKAAANGRTSIFRRSGLRFAARKCSTLIKSAYSDRKTGATFAEYALGGNS
jgi:hypothetical protein